jgi:hypothetical protein
MRPPWMDAVLVKMSQSWRGAVELEARPQGSARDAMDIDPIDHVVVIAV